MAIPKEHAIPELEALRASAEGLIANGFTGDTVPTRDDLALIGEFVQLFGFIELNLRRAVKLFVQTGLLTAAQGKKPAAANLVNLVIAATDKLDLSAADRADIVAKLKEIAFRHPFRNLLAHWAARRLPGEDDALVMFTMDERDAKQFSADAPEFDSLFYCIVRLPDLRGLLDHVKTYEGWLAHEVVQWHKRLAPSA